MFYIQGQSNDIFNFLRKVAPIQFIKINTEVSVPKGRSSRGGGSRFLLVFMFAQNYCKIVKAYLLMRLCKGKIVRPKIFTRLPFLTTFLNGVYCPYTVIFGLYKALVLPYLTPSKLIFKKHFILV